MKYKIINNPEVAPKLNLKEAEYFGIDVSEKVNSGVLNTKGPWNIPISYKALAVSKKYNRTEGYLKIEQLTIYGQRTIRELKTSGHKQEGSLSIDGKKQRCFTSSQLFDVEGVLIDVAIIHVTIEN